MLIKKLQYASWGNYFKITASAITEVWLHWVLEFSSTESQTWWPHRPGVFSCQARITPCAAKSTKWNTSVDTKKHQITKKLLKQYSWLFRRSVCGQPVRTPASLSHSLYYFQTWAWYETRHLLTCVSGCFVIIWIDCFRIYTYGVKMIVHVFFNHLCGYTSSVLLFLVSSLQKWRKLEFTQTIFNLINYDYASCQSSEIIDPAHDGCLMIFLVVLFEWNEL